MRSVKCAAREVAQLANMPSLAAVPCLFGSCLVRNSKQATRRDMAPQTGGSAFEEDRRLRGRQLSWYEYTLPCKVTTLFLWPPKPSTGTQLDTADSATQTQLCMQTRSSNQFYPARVTPQHLLEAGAHSQQGKRATQRGQHIRTRTTVYTAQDMGFAGWTQAGYARSALRSGKLQNSGGTHAQTQPAAGPNAARAPAMTCMAGGHTGAGA